MRTDGELVEAARKAAEKAYAPYSNFRVGASVLTSEGAMFSSANVENASYPVSQCAEANAINFAVSQGMRTIPVVAVACIDAEDVAGAYPCGRCRQIMSEFGVERILVTTGEGEVREHSLDDLLPFRFEL
jgi:cytidine deaminase